MGRLRFLTLAEENPKSCIYVQEPLSKLIKKTKLDDILKITKSHDRYEEVVINEDKQCTFRTEFIYILRLKRGIPKLYPPTSLKSNQCLTKSKFMQTYVLSEKAEPF